MGGWSLVKTVQMLLHSSKNVKLRSSQPTPTSMSAFGTKRTGSPFNLLRRDLIIALAARYRLPAVYNDRYFVAAGGLISYASNQVEQFRLAATYVDRILKGEKPADLPVQTPTKYELVINLKSAKALGLDVPPTLLARADEVIE